jgi:hypothetical protein
MSALGVHQLDQRHLRMKSTHQATVAYNIQGVHSNSNSRTQNPEQSLDEETASNRYENFQGFNSVEQLAATAKSFYPLRNSQPNTKATGTGDIAKGPRDMREATRRNPVKKSTVCNPLEISIVVYLAQFTHFFLFWIYPAVLDIPPPFGRDSFCVIALIGHLTAVQS